MAAAVGNVEVARALIAAGADPFSLTDGKIAPLHLAAGVGPPLARDWNEQEMNGLFGVTTLLVELGADVNAVGEHGWTPLHGAAYKGMDRTVQLLVDKGARVDVVDGYGQTPLSIASAVITAGVKDYYGQTPRIVRPSTRALLLKLGATPLAESGVQVFGLFEEKR
jgi:ankyrin repeat protein